MDRFSWQTTPFSWRLAEDLAEGLGVPLLVGVILARRGFTDLEQARTFLQADDRVPDPLLMPAMEAAVGLLDQALERGRRIVVHGDYDVDGVSATALMVRALEAFGGRVEAYLPNRFAHGYGLSRHAVEQIAAAGDALLVTVDCGVNYPEEVALARSLGLDVVVTDHHRPGEKLPDCPVVHPALGGYPEPDLCGVGVAFKLLHGLLVAREGVPRDRVPQDLLEHLDLVALGTIADLVPLRGENRVYVREGLVRLNATTKVGLQALIRVAGCEGGVDAGAVGFRLAPRLNAAGRLEDPEAPLRLLLTDDPREAETLAAGLDEVNHRRQEIEAGILREVLEQVEALDDLPTALVLAAEGWHEGVVGIVASRLVERYHRPSVLLVVKNGTAKGSARSIPAYDLMAGLRRCDHLLSVYGGHRQAAGMTLASTSVDAFRHALNEHAGSLLTEADLVPMYRPDAVVRGPELTLETVDALMALAPFGMGNPGPRLLALDARLDGAQLTRSGEHLRGTLVLDGVQTKGIGFRLGDALNPLREEDFACHAGIVLEADEWQGRARPQVKLHSLYRTGTLGEESLGCHPDCPFLDSLEAPPGCERCADPFRDVDRPVALVGRDLRQEGSPLSAVAQVLSSGEPAAVIGVSAGECMRRIAGRLPLLELGVPGVACVSRYCWRTRAASRPESLLFLDWQTAERRPALWDGKTHLLVLDPPVSAGNTVLLGRAAQAGIQVHLLFGPSERARATQLLRFMVHPRFWMVTLYRVWRDGLAGTAAWEEARRRAWADHGVLGDAAELQQAETLLRGLGLAPVVGVAGPSDSSLQAPTAAVGGTPGTPGTAMRLQWT